MSSSALVGGFDYNTHFNLAHSIEDAVRQGVFALILHFGDNHNNLLALSNAMRAYRRDVRRGGNEPTDHSNRIVIGTPMGVALLWGIGVVLDRFGPTAENRARVLTILRQLELDFERLNPGLVLPNKDEWDKDDDPDGPEPKPDQFAQGSRFGGIEILSPVTRVETP